MPIELILSPIMRPVVHAKSILFAPHRNASHYVPTIKEFPTDNSKISSYAVIKRIGSGNKILDVFDTNNGINPIGSPIQIHQFFGLKDLVLLKVDIKCILLNNHRMNQWLLLELV